MKKTAYFALLALTFAPAAWAGSVNIDGIPIQVSREDGGKWSASGGDDVGDQQRYVTYRKERAIELSSGCRIEKRLSQPKERTLVAAVKCS